MINTQKILDKCGLSFETSFLDEKMTYNEFNDFNELVEWLDSNDDSHEYADSMVDIYYYDLRNWAVENYEYIEEAIDELGAPEPFDFHKAIQYGQYHKYCQDIYEDCQEFKAYLEETYKF